MKTFKQLFSESKELEQQFSELRSELQNPDFLCEEDIEFFFNQVATFDGAYQSWKLEVIELLQSAKLNSQ